MEQVVTMWRQRNPGGCVGTTPYRIRIYVFDDDTLELGLAGDLDAVASADADRLLFSLAPLD
jgi:hypothetical protein